ncbi:MAG TPA: hypothetical protein VFC12_06885 [Terriglobales bacterium]|nr:hypothetical protein [Terriglobales bacterium]
MRIVLDDAAVVVPAVAIELPPVMNTRRDRRWIMSSHRGAGMGALAMEMDTWKIPHSPIAHVARTSGCEFNELIRLGIKLGPDICFGSRDPSP